jgi:hypothetical protein
MRIAGYVKFGVLVIVLSGVIALATPEHTSTAIRVAVFVLAGTIAVALLDLARRRAPEASTSPFEPRHRVPLPPSPPADVLRMAVELRAFDVGSEHGTVPTIVPGALRRAMQTVAQSRLAARPGAVVSPSLRAALEGEPVTADADELLDALEAL